MRILRPTQAWILICFVTVVSSGPTDHAPPRHDVSQHGENTAQKTLQKTVLPFGIQIPEHVLSTQDVACISADNNIFQIMNEAQKTCNGTDMKCTFYHFVNHGYENIGTLGVNKELFDDLLMKFDNWLLTAENIDKSDVHGKTAEGYHLDAAGININDRYINDGKVSISSNASKANGLNTNQGKIDHNISEFNDDKIHPHHNKNSDETHHNNHYHKWKNGNHIKLDTKYNDEHRYFEVFLPNDKQTGKPRTIYVEVDRDKNEFILLDEDIDKKLHGVKPIKIELDELHEIAETAFSDLVKSSNHKGHIHYNLDEDNRIMTNDLNTNPEEENHEIYLGIDADEFIQHILNSSVCNSNICNINASQQLISDNTTGNVKKITNVSKNLVVPNKYINQAQFHVESLINNTTNMIPNNNFEILQNTNETDITEPDFHENGLYKIIELDHNNITELDINNEENPSLEFIEIPCEDENSNCTEHHEFSIYHKSSYDDNAFIQLVENNDTDVDDFHNFGSSNTEENSNCSNNHEFSIDYENIPHDDDVFIHLVENNDINVDDTHNFGSSNTVHLKDLILKGKENKLKSTPDIYITQEHADLDTHSLVCSKPISSYNAVPILGKNLAVVVEADSNLQSSFPVYETVDSLSSDSQYSPVHPTVTFHNSPLDSVHGHHTIKSKIPQYISPKFPTSPVECAVGLKDSKYSILPSSPPLNFGFGWPPPYSPMEELRPPCAAKSFDCTPSLPVSVLPIKHPSKQFFDSPESTSSDHTMPVEDSGLFQNAPSMSIDVQKPCLITPPYYLEAITPTSKIDFPSTAPLSVIPNKSVGAVISPCPFQSPYLQPTKDNLGLINSPFDNYVQDTIIPSSGTTQQQANRNRYPCNTLPYFLSPYLKPPQVIPPYFDSKLPGKPLQITSKIPTFHSPPISLDQSYTCFNPDYPRETKPMALFPFVPTTPYLPFNPPWLESGLNPVSPSIWNNIPTMSSLPYSILPCQNMWNNPPTLNNYLAPTMELQQNQFLRPPPAKEDAKSVLEDSYSAKNILPMIPMTYAPMSSVFPRPVDILNPSFSLERDLQTLSCKYGIPLSKILDSLEKEMFDAHSKSSFDSPCSTVELDSSIKGKSQTNATINDEKRSGNEEILLESSLTNLIPLDSSLIGPDLEMDNAALLDSNHYQTYTVASETTGPLNAQLSLKNQPKKILKDSLIGQHLPTLSTSNFHLNDEDRIENAELHLESDSSSISPLDSSLIGPHLEISPSLELDSNISQGSHIVTSHIEAPDSSSSQKLLENSLKSPHLATLSEVKPVLSGGIQSIKDMISLESDLTELTPLDSSQVDLVNEHEQSEILQPEKPTITLSASTDSTKSLKSVETKPNLIEEEFLHLDPSLIGPHLQTESSSIHTDSVEQKIVTEITQNSLQNANELESIILPPSMLPTLLKKAVTTDINRNVHTQDAQLNEEHNELSLETNVELPITDISSVTPSLKETDFQIFEPTLVQSKIVKHKITSPEIIHVSDSEMQLDNSLIGPSIQEMDSREMSPILDSVDHLENTFSNQIKKLLTVPAAIDSEIEYDSSLTGPTLHKETKTHGSVTSSNFVTQHDTSTKGQSLKPGTDTTDESRAFDSKNILDSSLAGPHLSTAPFSIDEIKMIDKELQLESDLVHLTPLDSSLIGNHLDLEGLDESEISRHQDPELSGLVEEEFPLEPIPVATVDPSDLQELLSKFTNAITKSHLSPSEMKPCDKLLSSVAKISSDSENIPFEDFQTCSQLLDQDEVASEFSPIPQTILKPIFSPSESIGKGQPCINSNYFPMPVMFPQYANAKEASQIPITPYSPFVQMKPSLHHNWLGRPLNIQGSPGSRPVAENAPILFILNELEPLSSEEFKHLLYLASQSNIYPQLSNTNMFRPAEAISPLSEWTIPSQILPDNNYIPFLPKKSLIVLPSDKSIYDKEYEYNPVIVDDIMSLINENSHQILKDMPLSQSFVPHTNSEFDRDHILSPSLLDFVKTRPVSSIPHTNAMSPSLFYNPHLGMYDPQNIPYMEQTPLLYNIQPYFKVPEEAKFSEMIGPAPKLISLPSQFPNDIIESHFIESIANPLLEKEYLKQLLSKPCLDSPIVVPSSDLEAMLQLPTASNKLINVPSQPSPSYLPLAYFPSSSSTFSTPKSNAFTYPLLPNYASPLSVSSAKAISTSSNLLPLNLPNTASPIASPVLSINPYTTSTCISEFSSPLIPVKTELSDYTYIPSVAENRLIPSAEPYKPRHIYSSPYLPVQPSPMPFDTCPYSPFISKLAAATIYTPSYQPISAPYFKPAPKLVGDLGLSEYFGPVTPVAAGPIVQTQTGILSPSYHGSDPTFNYTPLPDTSTQTRPPSCLSTSYLTSIPQESVNVPMNFKYLPSNLISCLIPQITNQELQLLRPTALPGSCGNNPFSNAHQLKPISPNIPIPTYSTKVPKLSPFSNSKTKQNEPFGKVIQSNLQTSSLSEEEPFYNLIEENMYTHSNDKGEYYQGPSFNYPFESMSYTLAPEEMTETLAEKDLIIPEGLFTSALVNSHVYEQLSPTNECQRPGQTPYTSLYSKPCPKNHFSPPSSLTELNQQNICDNISFIPLSNPMKHSVSQPLKPFTHASKQTTLLYPCMDTSPNTYNMSPLTKKPLPSSPYYSTTSQGIATPPIDPRVLQDIVSSVFFQVPTNTPFTTVSPETLSQPPTSPIIQNNLKSYNRHTAHFSPIEEAITPQYVTPLSPAQNVKKIKPLFSPQCPSSISQAPITFQDCRPLYETPIHYQSFITPPTELVSSANKIFLSPAVTSPNTVLPCFNNIVEPLSTDLNKLKWSSFTPQYTLPASLSSPVPVPITTVPFTRVLPVSTPQTAKPALTNSIIPSSLFTIPETNLITPSNKLSPLHNIPQFSLPSHTYVEPLEILPYETLSSTLGNTVCPQNILKSNSQFSTGRFKIPTSSSPFLSQPLHPIDFYPVQSPNDQHNNKLHPKLSPVSSQYASSCYTSLPLETVANQLISKPQCDPPSVPIYDTPIHISVSGRNPFLKPDIKPIPEVPSYPIPNNLISLPKTTPFDSVLLSNLRPVYMSQDPLDLYSQMTPLSPLPSLSLLEPLANPLPQKSRLYQPANNPINSQYVSPIESNPQLLPSTSPIPISPLLKPLLTKSQNIAPLFPIHLSRLNTGSSESTPINYLPSVIGNYKYSDPSTSRLTEIPETAEPVNLLPPHSSRFNKLQQSPETMASMSLYSNYEIVEPAPELLMKGNIVSVAKPIEVSALDSSLISRDALDSEVRKEMKPAFYSKYRLSPLLMNLSQQRQIYPADTSIPKPTNFAPTLISKDVELIDTTDFIPLSQIKSEPLITEYYPTDRQASVIQNTPSTKPDISQFSPYTTLLNTKASPTYMKLPPKLQTPSYSNQFPRLPSLFLSPQEYKELTQGPTNSGRSSSSSNFLTLPNIEPQIVSSQLTGETRPVTLHTSPISSKLGSLLQPPPLERYIHEEVEEIPEKPSIETLQNYYRDNKIASQEVNRYTNGLIMSISEVPLEQKIVQPRLIKSGPIAKYEDKYSNDFDEYEVENMPYDEELEHISVVENRLGSIEAKSFTETLPEIVKGFNIPNYNEMAQRPQRLSKLNHFYANNHIGESPQVFTVPAYKTLPTDRKSPSTTVSPKLFKQFSNIPTQYFDAVLKLDTSSQMRPNEYYPENVSSTTYLNPYLKPYSQGKFPPNAVEIADTTKIPYEPSSYAPIDNIDDIKYSGYKTYQIPSSKSPKSTPNLGIPTQTIDPTVVTYSPPILAYKPLETFQQNPSNTDFYTPTEIYELHNTQSRRLVDMTTPLQTKLGLDNIQESPEYDEYNPIEDEPLSVDNVNEDNELKTILINYINNRGDVKTNLDDNDGELTIPIGNIAITKKEPHNADTIQTNNPSIGLKVWKSNVKIAQAEIKLKFKDLSVNNFMPVVNNIDKYDMEEIRKIIKNYIDEKYGAHIEVDEPYSIDNKYSIIKDFNHNAEENKYNLLWPTHFV